MKVLKKKIKKCKINYRFLSVYFDLGFLVVNHEKIDASCQTKLNCWVRLKTYKALKFGQNNNNLHLKL